MEMTNKQIEARKRELREQYLFLKKIEEAETSTTTIIVALTIHEEEKDEATTKRCTG